MCLYGSRCGFIFIWCYELKSDRQLLFGRLFGTCVVRLTAVLLIRPQSVQRVDSTIRWINHFPRDKLIDFIALIHPLNNWGQEFSYKWLEDAPGVTQSRGRFDIAETLTGQLDLWPVHET